MDQLLYRKLCVANIMNGVTEGLSKFSHPSRVSLIFAPDPDDPVMVLDPQDLLRGHGVKVHTTFSSEEGGWWTRIKTAINGQPRGHQIPENDLALSGLIFITALKSVRSATGGLPASIHRNRWFWKIF